MLTSRRTSPPSFTRLAIALLGCGSALAIAACGSDPQEAATTAGGGSVKGKEVVLITCTDANPWCAGFNTTLEKGLRKAGVEVTTLTSNFDPAKSSQQFLQGLNREPDLMLYYINDQNAAMPSLLAAKRAGVPVVVLDTSLNGEAAELVAGQLLPGHPQLGKFAAQNIQEGLQKQGVKSGNVIMITGTQSQYEAQQRINAFKTQMAKTPQYKIVSVQDGNWDPIKTGTIAQQLFAKYGKDGIQGAYGMADYMAAAISQAAAQAGIPLYPQSKEGLVVTGSNCAPTGVKAIQSGRMYGGATQAPTEEARNDVPYVIKALQGEKLGETVVMQNQRVTKENVDKYADMCTY